MAYTFVVEVSEHYRMLVAVDYVESGTQYYPQEQSTGQWSWMKEASGATVCFRSESRCRAYVHRCLKAERWCVGIGKRIEVSLEACVGPEATSLAERFLDWLGMQDAYERAIAYGANVEQTLSDLEVGEPVSWGAYQEACRGVLWLASLASTSGWLEVGMVLDRMYEYLCALAGFEEER